MIAKVTQGATFDDMPGLAARIREGYFHVKQEDETPIKDVCAYVQHYYVAQVTNVATKETLYYALAPVTLPWFQSGMLISDERKSKLSDSLAYPVEILARDLHDKLVQFDPSRIVIK